MRLRDFAGRLIGFALIELSIFISWWFGVNQMLVMVAMIGFPIFFLIVALPIAMLIRSNRLAAQNPSLDKNQTDPLPKQQFSELNLRHLKR